MPTHHYRCPYCERAVIMNDEERKSSHQVPVCAGWDRLMKANATTELGLESLPVDDDTPEN